MVDIIIVDFVAQIVLDLATYNIFRLASVCFQHIPIIL